MLSVIAVIAVVTGVAGLVWFLFAQRDELLSKLNSIAGVTNLAIAIISLVVTVAGVKVAMRSGRPVDAPNEARDRLRRAVRQQWDRELGIRKLRTPRPLRLTWAPSRGNVSARVVGAPAPTGGLALRAGVRPTAELMREFRDLPSRRLVVLGQAGAGKSVLAMLLTVDLLTEPQDDDPVPVLLPIAGWNPAEELGTWLARRVHEEYPNVVSASGAAKLVAANQVMAVLDGLDEMPAARMPEALVSIDAASEALWVVLTCRGAEYGQLIACHAPLSRAAVVEINSIDPGDAAVYLRDGEPEGDPRWLPVVSHMHTDDGKPLAEALSTPLMLSLARDAYRASTSPPSDLLTIADQGTEAVKRRVLTDFLPAVYARTEAGQRSYPALKAELWLRTLAGHLVEDRTDGVNLNWWQLDRAVPARLVGVFIAVALAILGTPVMFGVVLVVAGPENALGTGLACALLAAALAGAGTGRAVLGAPVRWVWPAVIAAALWAGLLGVFAFCSALACALLARARAARGTAQTFVGAPIRWVGLAVVTAALRDGFLGALACCSVLVLVDGRRASWDLDYLAELSQPALVIMLVGTAIGMITNGLAMTRSATPTRLSLSGRGLARGVLSGMGTAALVGMPVAPVAGTIIGIIEDSWLEGLRLGSVAAVATVVGLGLLIGVARALGSPVGDDQARSPRSVIFGDAITLALVTAVTSVAGGVALWLVADVSGKRDAPTMGIVGGVVLAAAVATGSGAPWVRFRVAHILLALRGRLPWRVVRFMEDAHSREVLRQSGGSYQFRHDLLQAHLTAADARPRSRAPRGGLARRAVHTAVAVLVLTAVTATITVPTLRDAVQTRIRQRTVAALPARIEQETNPRTKVRLALALATVRPGDVDFVALEAVSFTPPIKALRDALVVVDDDGVITAVDDRTIWRLNTRYLGARSKATLPARPRTFSAGGGRLITFAADSATVWRWHSGDLHQEFNADWTNAAVAPDGRRAIGLGRDSELSIVDLTTGVVTPLGRWTGTAPKMRFIDSKHALVSDSTMTSVFSVTGERSRRDVAKVWASTGGGRTLLKLHDGRTELWDTATGVRRDLGQPTAADISADGDWALLAFDGRSQLVDLFSDAPTQELPSSSRLTSDRRNVASTTAGTTEIRNLPTRNFFMDFDGTKIWIRPEPLNRIIATLPYEVSAEMTVALGTEMLAVKTENGIQLSALGQSTRPNIFLPNSRPHADVSDMSSSHSTFVVGDYILLWSANREFFVWDLGSLPQLSYDPGRGLACAVAERGFTKSEWEEHVPGMAYVQTCPPAR